MKNNKEFSKAVLYEYVRTAKELFYGEECVAELNKAKSRRECEMILCKYRNRASNEEIK